MKITAQKIMKEFTRQSKHTNCFTAVQETDFTLEAGNFTVLMGRSGSGKSTLLHMLAGLMQPTSGNILIDDIDLYTMPDKVLSAFRNQHIGVIPQGQTAVYTLNVLENICLPYTLYSKINPDVEMDAMALLEQLGIAELAHAMPAELSGGELRRMAIARALIRKPEIILADEPTSDLDEESTAIVFSALKNAASQNTVVLMITHENDAQHYADTVWHMHAGILKTE